MNENILEGDSMIKLVLWDYTGDSAAWCEKFLRPNVAEIVRTLRPDDADQVEVIMRGDWDYVLIFADDDTQKIFDEILETIQAMNVATDKIIFATNYEDWIKNPAALYSLPKPSEAIEKFYRYLNFVNHRKWHHYAACDAEDLHYVGTSQDECIIPFTYMTNENFVADDIKTFHALAKKFYGVDDSDGYFLDLGANIGTTGIYFVTKLAPRLKLFAVEPDLENFKLLRVNLILNDLEPKTTLVNCGLGDDFDTLTIQKNFENPGGNGFIPSKFNTPAEELPIAPLDYLLAESEIAPEKVKYIWIDTEGFEAKVLLGAKNLLAKSRAPVFMECNLLAWKNSNALERMVDMLAELGYTKFIPMVRSAEEKIYPIENLLVAVNYAAPPLGQVGDIFLINEFVNR